MKKLSTAVLAAIGFVLAVGVVGCNSDAASQTPTQVSSASIGTKSIDAGDHSIAGASAVSAPTVGSITQLAPPTK